MVSEFEQTMRDWRRMCDKMNNEYAIGACTNCPLFSVGAKRSGCAAIHTDWAAHIDWGKVASIIETWAAEHPEPVYPTWAEWLMSIGVISGLFPNGAVDALGNIKLPIPADIAEKLGLKPKGEGNGV